MNEQILDAIGALAEFRLTREQARAGLCCIRCQDPIDEDWTAIDVKEWAISLLCGQCFDQVTEEQE